jgi:hypothetical protein
MRQIQFVLKLIFDRATITIMIFLMKNTLSMVALFTFALLMGTALASTLAGQTGQSTRPGRLIVWGDLALFQPPQHPEGCTLRNRFERGDPVGFRLFAIDGSTNQPELSAQLIVHLTYAGKKIDLPALNRSVAQFPPGSKDPMPIRPGLWTAKWIVPNDAQTGIVRYTVTGRDKYGRTVEFAPPGPEPTLLTIVQ